MVASLTRIGESSDSRVINSAHSKSPPLSIQLRSRFFGGLFFLPQALCYTNRNMNTIVAVRRGFTLVEIAVIILIIGILVTLGTFAYGGMMNRNAETAAEGDLRQAAARLESHKMTNGRYPATQEEVDGGKGLPKSADDRVYTYRASTTAYCLSTIVKRVNEPRKIEQGASTVSAGDCSSFASNEPPLFNYAGADHWASFVYWDLPAGVSSSENARIKVTCDAGPVTTVEMNSLPAGVQTSGPNGIAALIADWNSTFSCEIGASTIRVSYQSGGVWSQELTIPPSMMDIW